MNISYNWLKEYVNIDLDVNKLESILTAIGLEVGGIEEVQSVKGGLEGLVIGKVLSCEKHPNAERLSVTTVDVGGEEPLPIVCGAPNVAAGQKVVVATVGTVLYSGDESFKIKKSKIRGEVSQGMICAEDEIGLGTSHDGIMVLESDVPVGTLARDYFKIENDYQIEVDLTPNRIDGASHIGVARDLVAYLQQEDPSLQLKWPSVDSFKVESNDFVVDVRVENTEACPRYTGLTMTGIEIKESPEWLQNRLKAIGMKPINNVVDITNFVLHETGQPLHAFDGDKITGNKVIVKTLPNKTSFKTLDEEERELTDNDLMICNASEGMCIAGVFGGADSGVSANTTKVFLECAYFNPVWVRKTARRHQLNTDSSFRFERGVDPNNVIYALKRTALLIKELAGGTISSEIVDIYPNAIEPFDVEISLTNVHRLIGEKIAKDKVINILKSLEIEVTETNDDVLSLKVPTYRVDVKREADVIEEILRIYGYNTIEAGEEVHSTLTYIENPDQHKIKNLTSELLSSVGFNEIMSNSLSQADYYNDLKTYPKNNVVQIFNPLSQDLNAMRQSMLFGGLESIAYNKNRKNGDLKLYEFGNCYYYNEKGKEETNALKAYSEDHHLALFLTGKSNVGAWDGSEKSVSFFDIKSTVENVLNRLGVKAGALVSADLENELFAYGMVYLTRSGDVLVTFGKVNAKIAANFDVEQDVFYADIQWDVLSEQVKASKTSYRPIAKFPEVKRDLALLVDKTVKFATIEELAFKTERKLLKQVNLFDIYEGKNLPDGKKSYAVSFTIQDETKTLTDKQIDKIMQRFIQSFSMELGAQLR